MKSVDPIDIQIAVVVVIEQGTPGPHTVRHEVVAGNRAVQTELNAQFFRHVYEVDHAFLDIRCAFGLGLGAFFAATPDKPWAPQNAQ